mmetsp:Transcript_86713/g.250246  ORF Transcript_86713/g.250246 Transcript_86713/m.250246 type:complete len:353 (+) Transcript_86713:129-1187(+)
MLKSSASRWKPLFKFGRQTVVRPFSDPANKQRASGGDAAKAKKPPPGEARPLKGSLSPVPFPSARSIGKKIKFAGQLITEEIEPTADMVTAVLGVDGGGAPGRSSTRKATGFHFSPESKGGDAAGPADADSALAAAPAAAADDDAGKQGKSKIEDELAELGADVESGFGSDDEFDELHELASKNAKINKEATRLVTPSASPRGQACSQLSSPRVLPIEARQLQKQCSRQSSFCSSEGSFGSEPPMQLPGATTCVPATGWQPVPPGATAAAPAMAKRASTASSFGASSDGEEERPRLVADASPAAPKAAGQHSEVNEARLFVVGAAKEQQTKSTVDPVDDGASSFADSSDDER